MGSDSSLEAVTRAWQAIRDLDARSRAWVIDSLRQLSDLAESAPTEFGDRAAGVRESAEKPQKEPAIEAEPGFNPLRESELAEFCDWIDRGYLATNADRILVSLALLQKANPSVLAFSASQIHEPLRQLGRPIGNVSQQLKSIVNRVEVAWISQIGRGKTGFKRYRITEDGVRAAELLSRGDSLIRYRGGRRRRGFANRVSD